MKSASHKTPLTLLRQLLAGALVLVFAAFALAESDKPRGYANEKVSEENGVVTICYDLLVHHAARVTLSASANGQALEVKTVSGDVGIVLGPAVDKCLKWNTIADYPNGLSGVDVSLELAVEDYAPPEGMNAAGDDGGRKAPENAASLAQCVSEKLGTGLKSEKDEVAQTRNDYVALLSNDQAPFIQMMQKVKGGVPFVKRWTRDKDGNQVPVYQYEELPEREKAKLQRELDKQWEKAERNPTSVISTETRRTKEKYENAVNRLFNRISAACEREIGVPSDSVMEYLLKTQGSAYILPEPFEFIKKERDWE